MKNIVTLIHDIFSMSFDVVIPVSGSIVAVLVAFLLFSLRYWTFRHKLKKYAGQPAEHRLTPRTRPQPAAYPPLEAAAHCDPGIFRFFTAAIARGAPQAAGEQTDLQFRAALTSELRRKAPQTETGETAE